MLKLVIVLSASHFPARILPLAFKPETAEMSLRCNISWLIKSCWQQQKKTLKKHPVTGWAGYMKWKKFTDWFLSRLHEMKEVHWLVPEQVTWNERSSLIGSWAAPTLSSKAALFSEAHNSVFCVVAKVADWSNQCSTDQKKKKNDCSTYYLIINPVFKPSIQKILQICSGWHPWTYNGNQEHFQHSLCQSIESIPSIIKTLD